MRNHEAQRASRQGQNRASKVINAILMPWVGGGAILTYLLFIYAAMFDPENMEPIVASVGLPWAVGGVVLGGLFELFDEKRKGKTAAYRRRVL